ncbi:proline-rich protein 2-like [Trichosurus vulpecula]|uniref:proline-rich protein 2-like n=1 Tax=Trichosurus vulpecula TaxID=9337 RepID=UPI00186AE6B6|nr:proline-rich protein 2-like [Trichosurus vulpecula]
MRSVPCGEGSLQMGKVPWGGGGGLGPRRPWRRWEAAGRPRPGPGQAGRGQGRASGPGRSPAGPRSRRAHSPPPPGNQTEPTRTSETPEERERAAPEPKKQRERGGQRGPGGPRRSRPFGVATPPPRLAHARGQGLPLGQSAQEEGGPRSGPPRELVRAPRGLGLVLLLSRACLPPHTAPARPRPHPAHTRLHTVGLERDAELRRLEAQAEGREQMAGAGERPLPPQDKGVVPRIPPSP